jgi:hypothetical protein
MADKSSDWQRAYLLAKSETDADRRNELCDRARRLIQDRSLELASSSAEQQQKQDEEDQLNKALRELWMLQNPPK